MTRLRRPSAAALLLATVVLGGCDAVGNALGIESASAAAARRESEGKAIGAGCRHAGRSVEACFALNRRADKAAIFAGWREMSEYMAENKIEAQPPPPEVTAAEAAAGASQASDSIVDKPDAAKLQN